MSLKYADRVQESTTGKSDASTAYNLSGAIIGHRTFVSGIGDTNLCIYAAQQVDGQGVANGQWEIGVGTVTDASPDTLARTSLMASSTGSFIDWSATGVNSNPRVYVASPAAFNASRGGASPAAESGRWFGPDHSGAFTTSAVIVDRLRAALVSWPVGVPINKIGIEITAITSGGTSRLGIYEDAGGQPGNLLVDAGTFTETVAIHTITLSPKVYPKTPWLWLAHVGDDALTSFRSRDSADLGYAKHLGFADAGIVTPIAGMWVASGGSPAGGLPSVFGTPTVSSDVVPEIRIQI